MQVLNTFLAVAGWVWTVMVICFAAGYMLGYRRADIPDRQGETETTP